MWVSLQRCYLCVRDKGNGLFSVSGVTGFSGHKTNSLSVLLQDTVNGLTSSCHRTALRKTIKLRLSQVRLQFWGSGPLFVWPTQVLFRAVKQLLLGWYFRCYANKRDLVCFSKTKPWRWPGSPVIVVVSRGDRARAWHAAARFEAQKHCAHKNMSGSWQNMCHFFWFLAAIRTPARVTQVFYRKHDHNCHDGSSHIWPKG